MIQAEHKEQKALIGQLQYRRFSTGEEARAARWLPRIRAILEREFRVIDGEAVKEQRSEQ
jgi:hypothetical protein